MHVPAVEMFRQPDDESSYDPDKVGIKKDHSSNFISVEDKNSTEDENSAKDEDSAGNEATPRTENECVLADPN